MGAEPLVGADGIPITAHMGRRVAAFVIDYGIMTVTVFVAVVIAIGIYESTGDTPFEELSETEQNEISYLGFAVWSLPFFIGTWVLNATGGSLGKRILGLRIVRQDLSSPGWSVGLGRTAAAWLSSSLFGLGFLWATWDDRGQTFHDKLAGTYVVRADSLRASQHPDPAPRSLH